MGTNSKTTMLLGLAFILGGAAGFFIAKKLLQEHYAELSQMEIDDVKSYYEKKFETGEYKKLTERYQKPDLEEFARKYSEEEPEQFDTDEEGEPYNDEEDLEEAEDIYISDEMEMDDVEDEEEIEEIREEFDEETQSDKSNDYETDGEHDTSGAINSKELPIVKPTPEPHIISYNEFVDEEEYDKIDLFYYRFDEKVCDVNDQLLKSPNDILGHDWKEALTRRTTTFVRNDEMETDFEIHSLSKSYDSDVLARRETDKEREYRRIARQKQAIDDFADEFKDEKPRKPKTEPYSRPKNVKYDEE